MAPLACSMTTVRRLDPNPRNAACVPGPRDEWPLDLQAKRNEVVQRLVRERGYEVH